MTPLLLICALVSLQRGHALRFSDLNQSNFQFFTNTDDVLGAVLSQSFMVNVPSCINAVGYVPSTLKVAVANRNPTCMVDTDSIKSLKTDPTAPVYYTGQMKVPQCRLRRDLEPVKMNSMRDLGYQVGTENCTEVSGPFCNQFLQPGTSYWVNFIILDETDTPRAYTGWSEPRTTRQVRCLDAVDLGLSGHSGGMVIITVLLSVSVFLLLLGFMAVVVVSRAPNLFTSESKDCLDMQTQPRP
ncbi:uroplakin-2 [Xenopus laevis]|uniref:Uroplakin-2 n=2 Tax=Xenopus laevis TaxID=8355 RepID=A0A1L8GW18_XENLA|nr:uroplakin-2 [Xenopus laevis]OCT88038.1 hypothetical protein XELAEV_18016667mg [Xenopus laevis]